MKQQIKKTSLQSGAAMIETIIAFPILMFVGFAVVHIGLIYQAKSNLKYAAFMSARQAVSTSLGAKADDTDPDSYHGLDELRKTIRCRMAAYDPLPAGAVCDDKDLPATEMSKVQIRFMRPAKNAFMAWGTHQGGGSCLGPQIGCRIDNYNLLARNPLDEKGLGINIQDANIMTIRVRYLVDTGVPFINSMFQGDQQPDFNMNQLVPGSFAKDPFNKQRQRPGVWLEVDSSMLMQSEAQVSQINQCAFVGFC